MQDTTFIPTPAPLPVDLIDRLYNIPCPDCAGEGHFEVLTGAGWFSMREECWYPDERLEPCPTCRATGFTGRVWGVDE